MKLPKQFLPVHSIDGIPALVLASSGVKPSKPICYADSECEGKVLSNRDMHNCRVKSRGKSWRPYSGGDCYRL
jgi:hypothetical protein